MYAVKEIIDDAVLFAPQIEPSCFTISNLQNKTHSKFAPHLSSAKYYKKY